MQLAAQAERIQYPVLVEYIAYVLHCLSDSNNHLICITWSKRTRVERCRPAELIDFNLRPDATRMPGSAERRYTVFFANYVGTALVIFTSSETQGLKNQTSHIK